MKRLFLALALLFVSGAASAQTYTNPIVTSARPTAFQILQASASGTTWAPATIGGDLYASVSPGLLYVSGLTGSGGSVAMKASGLTWSAALTPSISQTALTTASGTGATFTIQAQNETGGTSTGGSMRLAVGTGTVANGGLTLDLGTHPTGAYNYASVAENGGNVVWMGQWPNSGLSYGIWLGTPSPTTSNFTVLSDNYGDTALNGSASLSLEAANYVMATVSQTAILAGAPILGGAVGVSNTSPFGVHGERSIAPTSSRALTNTEYDSGRQIFTGAGGYTLTYPAVSSNLASYGKWITNSATATMTFGNGGASTITIASGATSFVWFDASGAAVLK